MPLSGRFGRGEIGDGGMSARSAAKSHIGQPADIPAGWPSA